MCDPTSLALAATVVSAAISAGSAYQQGQTAKKMANYNATMAEYAAVDAQRRGEQEVQAVQRRAAAIKGSQRSLMASRGLDLGEGTPAEIVDQTDFFGEQDINTARDNAKREAWSLRARRGQELFAGDAAARQGNLQAAGTLIGSAGSVAGKWSSYGRPSGYGSNDFSGVNGGNATSMWLRYGRGGD